MSEGRRRRERRASWLLLHCMIRRATSTTRFWPRFSIGSNEGRRQAFLPVSRRKGPPCFGASNEHCRITPHEQYRAGSGGWRSSPLRPIFLTLDEITAIHQDQIARYGGSEGIRDLGMLQSAAAMPAARVGGEFCAFRSLRDGSGLFPHRPESSVHRRQQTGGRRGSLRLPRVEQCAADSRSSNVLRAGAFRCLW